MVSQLEHQLHINQLTIQVRLPLKSTTQDSLRLCAWQPLGSFRQPFCCSRLTQLPNSLLLCLQTVNPSIVCKSGNLHFHNATAMASGHFQC